MPASSVDCCPLDLLNLMGVNFVYILTPKIKKKNTGSLGIINIVIKNNWTCMFFSLKILSLSESEVLPQTVLQKSMCSPIYRVRFRKLYKMFLR